MNGQWIGRYDGSRRGQIIVNIDERQSFFEGVASIIDDDQTAPSAVAITARSIPRACVRLLCALPRANVDRAQKVGES